jgi:hypothetical protein
MGLRGPGLSDWSAADCPSRRGNNQVEDLWLHLHERYFWHRVLDAYPCIQQVSAQAYTKRR